jgi:hypothetical protein
MPPRAAHRAHPLEVGGAAEAMRASHDNAALAAQPTRPSAACVPEAAAGGARGAHPGCSFA